MTKLLRIIILHSLLLSGVALHSDILAFPVNQIETQTTETDKLLREGADLLRQGKFDEALANSAKAAALSPNDFRPQLLAAYAYSGQRKLKSASESFAAAIHLQPQIKELYLDKAQVDYLRNAPDEVVAACRKAVELDPHYAEAYLMIGSVLRFNDKKREEAIAALQKVIELKPKTPEAYDYLGEVFENAKDNKRAEEVFRQGMAADPKHMAGRFYLGRMLVKQGRLEEARQLWEGRTSDEDRTFPNFIAVLKRAENLKSATDALAKKPKDPAALIDMGFAVMEGDSWIVDGRQKRAIVYFRQALELKPDSARAQYGIVKGYIEIADVFKDENKSVDAELEKLRKLDAKMADEMEAYRKNYHGALRAFPVKDQ